MQSISIKAIIFDMDGLLVDSEPLWHIAEIETFARVGVQLTEHACLQTTGLRVDEVVAYWFAKLPWTEPAQGEVATAIVDRVIALIAERAEPKPGVDAALDASARRGLRVALCSSSSRRIIDAVLQRLAIGAHFEVIHSAEHEPFGKPHPAVYQSTARLLGLAPADCLAVEDSPNGVKSAVAAGMACIAVPDRAHRSDPAFASAKHVLSSLSELDAAL
jgi:HAD superfamily hydrolase (TIGR01509 family)